jgi:hypothetical protein
MATCPDHFRRRRSATACLFRHAWLVRASGEAEVPGQMFGCRREGRVPTEALRIGCPFWRGHSRSAAVLSADRRDLVQSGAIVVPVRLGGGPALVRVRSPQRASSYSDSGQNGPSGCMAGAGGEAVRAWRPGRRRKATRRQKPLSHGGFSHLAFFYRDERDYLTQLAAFADAGLASG